MKRCRWRRCGRRPMRGAGTTARFRKRDVDQSRIVACACRMQGDRNLPIRVTIGHRWRIAAQQVVGAGVVANGQLRRLTGADVTKLPVCRWTVALQHRVRMPVRSPLSRLASLPARPAYRACLIGGDASGADLDHGTVLAAQYGFRLPWSSRDGPLLVPRDDDVFAGWRDIAVVRRLHLRAVARVRLAGSWQQTECRTVRELENGLLPRAAGQWCSRVRGVAIENRRAARQSEAEGRRRCSDLCRRCSGGGERRDRRDHCANSKRRNTCVDEF